MSKHTTTRNISYDQNLLIPTTISKEAQEELRNTAFDPSTVKVPDPEDLNGWKKQYLDSESMFMTI
jgi:hypothetical protein